MGSEEQINLPTTQEELIRMISDPDYVPDFDRFGSTQEIVEFKSLSHSITEIEREMLDARDYMVNILEQVGLDQKIVEHLRNIPTDSFQVDESHTRSAAAAGSYYDYKAGKSIQFVIFGIPLAKQINAFATSPVTSQINRKLAEKIIIRFTLFHELAHLIQEFARYQHTSGDIKDVSNIGIAVDTSQDIPDLNTNLNSADRMGTNSYGSEVQAQSLAMSILVNWLQHDPVVTSTDKPELHMLLAKFYLNSYPYTSKLFQLMYGKDLGDANETRTYQEIKQSIQARINNAVSDNTRRKRLLGLFDPDKLLAYTALDLDAGLELIKKYTKTPEEVDRVLRPVSPDS